MSHTSSFGFDGVSIHTSRAPSTAAQISSVSVATNCTSTPCRRSWATNRTPG